jgi:hypothetical protein
MSNKPTGNGVEVRDSPVSLPDRQLQATLERQSEEHSSTHHDGQPYGKNTIYSLLAARRGQLLLWLRYGPSDEKTMKSPGPYMSGRFGGRSCSRHMALWTRGALPSAARLCWPVGHPFRTCGVPWLVLSFVVLGMNLPAALPVAFVQAPLCHDLLGTTTVGKISTS